MCYVACRRTNTNKHAHASAMLCLCDVWYISARVFCLKSGYWFLFSPTRRLTVGRQGAPFLHSAGSANCVHSWCTTTDFFIAIEAGREGSRASRLDPSCFQPRDPKSQGGAERALSVGLSRKVVQQLLCNNCCTSRATIVARLLLCNNCCTSRRLLLCNNSTFVVQQLLHKTRPKK